MESSISGAIRSLERYIEVGAEGPGKFRGELLLEFH